MKILALMIPLFIVDWNGRRQQKTNRCLAFAIMCFIWLFCRVSPIQDGLGDFRHNLWFCIVGQKISFRQLVNLFRCIRGGFNHIHPSKKSPSHTQRNWKRCEIKWRAGKGKIKMKPLVTIFIMVFAVGCMTPAEKLKNSLLEVMEKRLSNLSFLKTEKFGLIWMVRSRKKELGR